MTPDVANLFRALSFALKGVSGEEEWEALRIRPPPSILGEPTASASASASVPILSPLQRLPYLYWALLLRRDLPAAPASTTTATSADPHVHPIRTLTDVVALGDRLRSALAPVFYEINMRYGPGNPVFDVISPYVATKSAPIDAALLSDAIGYYARNAPIQDILQYVIPSDKNWRTYMDGFKGDESIQKRYGKQAAALLVSLLLEKMLTP